MEIKDRESSKEWYTKAAIIYLYKFLESGCKEYCRNELAEVRLYFNDQDGMLK